MKTTMHIRPAEGGDDAKLLAEDLSKSYLTMLGRLG
jgi:protein subunit release factor A